MRHLRVLWTPMVALAACALAQAADAPKIPTVALPIESVTVFEDRALVRRAGSVQAVNGVITIRVSGLPVGLDEASLRASLPDKEAAKVSSVTTRTEQTFETQDVKLRALETQQDEWNMTLRGLDAKAAVLASEADTLAKLEAVILRSLSERATLGTVKPEELEQSSAFLARRRSAIADARREIAQQRAEIQKKLEELKKNIRQIAAPARKTVRYADVVIEAPQKKKIKLALSYLIAGARWTPRYGARLQDGKLVLQYMGEVRQGTGEDWKDVELILSTARPSLGATRPTLTALRLDLRETKPGKGLISRGVASVQEDAAAGADVDVAGAAGVRDSGTSVVFAVPGRSTVPSDRRAYKLPITSFADETPRLSFESVPKLVRYVYLKCATANKTAFPMLAGPVDVFRGSGFIGTSSLPFIAPGKSFSLSFGIDGDLKVRRTRDPYLTRLVRRGWRKEFHFAFDTEIANYKKTKQTVNLIDNIPVADVEEVRVMMDPKTDKPDTHNEKSGRLTWSLTLEPGEKKSIRFRYTVVVPKDLNWNPFQAAAAGRGIRPEDR